MKVSDHLKKLKAEAQALLTNTAIIKTQEGRAILTLLTRLIEIQADGEPATKPLTTHHE